MSSLDSAALTQDLDGMAFLAGVLGPAEVVPTLASAFDPSAPRRGWVVNPADERDSEAGQFGRVTEAA